MSYFLFRPQRGGLAESMAGVLVFASRAELATHLQQGPFPGILTTIEPYGPQPDRRIGWNTHIVMARWPDGSESPAGFTDGPVDGTAVADH